MEMCFPWFWNYFFVQVCKTTPVCFVLLDTYALTAAGLTISDCAAFNGWKI